MEDDAFGEVELGLGGCEGLDGVRGGDWEEAWRTEEWCIGEGALEREETVLYCQRELVAAGGWVQSVLKVLVGMGIL